MGTKLVSWKPLLFLFSAFAITMLLSFEEKVVAQGSYKVYLPLVVRNFPPIHSESYYVGSLEYAQMEALANQFADKVLQNSEQTDHLVLLSFCNPGTYNGQQGAYMCRNKGYLPSVQAGALAANFALTWLNRTANTPHRLWIAIGVNNYTTAEVTTAHAQSWALARFYARFSVTDNLRAFFVGAMDAEVEWKDAATTRAWFDAYMNGQHGCTPGSGINACLYNFGNANCGYSPTNAYCGYSDWDKDDIWYISAGAKRSSDQYHFVAALPEIYNTQGAQARQWQSVSLYGATTPGKRKVYFVGSLTTFGACSQVGGCSGIDNLPSTGYLQLYNELSKDSRTTQTPIVWSADIKYQVFP